MIDYDTYLERETEKYHAEQEQSIPTSNCCGVTVEDSDTNDICPECLEHCVIVTLGEYQHEEYENAMCDAGDAQRDLERER